MLFACIAVVEVGDDISECINDEAIVMLNHQSTADVPVLMSLISHTNKGTLAHHVDYIMDVMFRYFPFGWVGLMHGDFFIRQVCSVFISHLSMIHLSRDICVPSALLGYRCSPKFLWVVKTSRTVMNCYVLGWNVKVPAWSHSRVKKTRVFLKSPTQWGFWFYIGFFGLAGKNR